MRLVYLNADPGVPLRGSKGASVHVRGLVKALGPHVDKLAIVTAADAPRKGEPVPEELPGEIIAAGIGGGSGSRELDAFAGNDGVAEVLDALHARGDLDAIYERHSLAGVAGAEAARRLGVPRVVEVNAPLVDEAARHRGLRLRSLAAFVERRNLVEADRVVVVSDALREHVRDLGADPARVFVVPNGYDATLFPEPPPARPAAPGGRPFTVVFVGSLKPWHGLDVLVDAFARLHTARPRSRLLVVGDGPLADEARRHLRRLVPEAAFALTGAVAHREIPALLREADAAVAPYPPLEPFYFSPLKMLEYCAAGLPVVASGSGQIRDLLVDGESALLVPPGDAPALARALERLADDPELRARLGRGARGVARGRSWEDVAARVLAILRDARETARTAPAGASR